MPRRALTDRLILSLTSLGKRQHEHFDGFCPGLLLRVTSCGRKTWDFVFRCPTTGKRVRMRIGHYPAVTLAAARERALEAHRAMGEGRDPRVVEIIPTVKTMKALIEDRLAMELRGKKRSASAVEWRANAYIIPLVGNVPVADFRIDPHYNLVTDPHVKRGRVRTAGTLFQDLRAYFNFAIRRGVIEYSRIARVKRPDIPMPRTRHLTCEEIAIVWHALPEVLTRSDHGPSILRLCLVTGQRIGEVSGIHKSEVDLKNRVWTIPAARSKNKHEHAVPLSDLALTIIREAMRNTNGEILFPNRDGTGPLGQRAINHALLNAQKPRKNLPLGKFGIPRWSPHDLRRTVATQMATRANGLGIAHIDIGHVLNHRSITKSSVTQVVYIQGDFVDEKREALERWGAFLTSVIEGQANGGAKIAAE